MSEIILGVLKMPYDMFWADDSVVRVQHDRIRLEAAAEIERLRSAIAVKDEALRTASKRFEYLHLGGVGVVNGISPEVGQKECDAAREDVRREAIEDILYQLIEASGMVCVPVDRLRELKNLLDYACADRDMDTYALVRDWLDGVIEEATDA